MGCVHHGHCEHELLHVGKTSKNFPKNTGTLESKIVKKTLSLQPACQITSSSGSSVFTAFHKLTNLFVVVYVMQVNPKIQAECRPSKHRHVR